MLGSVFEGFMKQMIDTQRVSQEQWSRFLENTLGLAPAPPANPFDWPRAMMDAFRPPASETSATPPAPTAEDSDADSEVVELRRQLEALTRRVEGLSEAPDKRPASVPDCSVPPAPPRLIPLREPRRPRC